MTMPFMLPVFLLPARLRGRARFGRRLCRTRRRFGRPGSRLGCGLCRAGRWLGGWFRRGSTPMAFA